MKKVIALMIGVVTAATGFSQLSLGVQATGNLSDASIETVEFLDPTKNSRVLPGGGIVADIKVSPSLSLRTGVNFLQSGIKLEASMTDIPGEINEIATKGKLNMNYLQVPLNILYTTKGSTQFFVGGGPYFSYAVSGKSTQETTMKFSDGSVVTDKEETDPFEKDDEGETYWKRTDFGVGAIAGVKLPGGFFANIGYQFSFNNLSKADDEKYRNRGLQLTVGYYLWRK
ncbi:MAG TPA: porin family protein [Chitinophagaceae bacterium]